MPAYRSTAEAEIRDAVVSRLRELRPAARIIHEINCATWGPNRIDVIAVSKAEIIAVEIKSAKDKLDRLPKQIASMRLMAHHTIVALHEKFLVEAKTNQWSAHYERDGTYYLMALPEQCAGVTAWVFPERRRVPVDVVSGGYDQMAHWKPPRPRFDTALPTEAIDMLWADELRELCVLLRVPVHRRSTRDECMRALRWLATGREITEGVCRALRRRNCPEADAPVMEEAA